MIRFLGITIAFLTGTGPLQSQDERRFAIERGLELVQKAARNYPKHRECFSCHHQTLPMLAMVTARSRGFAIDETLLKRQAEFTHKFYTGRIDRVREGEAVGGRGLTAGYALWALDLANHPADKTTHALISYLMKTQEIAGHWRVQTVRPPLEETNITGTFLASYYMDRFAQDRDVSKTVDRAKAWLESAEPGSQEGRNMKLFAAKRFGRPEEEIQSLRQHILDDQQEDGGWGQLEKMGSDAYATGQTLFILTNSQSEDSTSAYDQAIEKGIRFLLRDREQDGSWHVASRSKPIQKMFDNGDPHGRDQFISTPATAWAVAALAMTLPH